MFMIEVQFIIYYYLIVIQKYFVFFRWFQRILKIQKETQDT